MNTRIFLNRFAGGFLAIILGIVILQGVSFAGATETPAPTSSSGADLELPSVPVLTTPAGVLPTSPLIFLDRFDEFVGRTFFTFGIPSLRTQALAHQAAERIAELQLLDTQGIRTRAMSVRNLEEFSDLLDRAMRIPLEQVAQGSRSTADLHLVVRTMIAGDDAILSMSGDTADEEETTLPMEENNSPLSAERRLIQTLQQYQERIPKNVLQNMAMELFAAAVRRTMIETTERTPYTSVSSSKYGLLQHKVDVHLQVVRSHLTAGRPHDALSLLHELTILQELLLTPAPFVEHP